MEERRDGGQIVQRGREARRSEGRDAEVSFERVSLADSSRPSLLAHACPAVTNAAARQEAALSLFGSLDASRALLYLLCCPVWGERESEGEGEDDVEARTRVTE